MNRRNFLKILGALPTLKLPHIKQVEDKPQQIEKTEIDSSWVDDSRWFLRPLKPVGAPVYLNSDGSVTTISASSDDQYIGCIVSAYADSIAWVSADNGNVYRSKLND